jgi:hypothetical protein
MCVLELYVIELEMLNLKHYFYNIELFYLKL